MHGYIFHMRYEIIDTETGDILRRYAASDAKRAKAHGNQQGCKMLTIKQPRKPNNYQQAMQVVGMADF